MRTIVSAGVVAALLALTPQDARAQAPTLNADTVIKSVENALGILRARQEEESLMTIQYWGTGTMSEVGAGASQPGPAARITSYYGSIAYDFPGMRVDFTRMNPDGSPQRQIRVVSGTFAWDEVEEGGGLDPKLGKAVPAMNVANDRLLQLWMTPLGVIKAARAAVANAKATIGEDKNGVITFALTGPKRTSPATNVVVGPLAGTQVKLTLDAQNRPGRVEVQYGGRRIETTYTEYGDFNGADYLSDVFLPRRTVQKVDGQTVLDLTITKTNTYNPYVIMPVPLNVQQAAAAVR